MKFRGQSLIQNVRLGKQLKRVDHAFVVSWCDRIHKPNKRKQTVGVQILI
ncbi:hypothetical protein [Acaryochloris sp. CCMEE 5410]|nr:hypothetical protein [Acaryochloris sp. CCMEE 5410]KAI9133632.1 hypothetical protein ON05_010190 [Acaryochloris sp. CCMEE 5410]